MCLQVCDWIYPLYPDSPVFLSNKGVFTFPDTTAAVPGSYVGVVLSSELPAADRDLFQEQLAVLAQLRVQVINLTFDFKKKSYDEKNLKLIVLLNSISKCI